MTPRCTELDLFFDGELETDHAATFRDHLATCERCQRVLLGRMQEAVAADAAAETATSALDDAIAAADAGGPDAERAASAHASLAAEPPPVTVADVSVTDRAASARASLAAELQPVAVADVSVADRAASPRASRAPEPGPAAVGDAHVPISEARRAECRRRVLFYAAPVVAAAAALPFIWFSVHNNGPLELDCPIKYGSTRARGVAHVGDILNPIASGERHRAIVVYFERERRTACPGDGLCSETDGKLELLVTLKEPGLYTVVALGSDDELPQPILDKTIDELLAQCSRSHCERRTIRVDD